jgi:nucleoside-diphosphate-sugar epimerase
VKLGAEVFWGDVADIESFDRAFRNCDLVVHLAAGTSGSEKDSEQGTIQGTRNLIELCRLHKPRKLIYISSCSVYGIAQCRRHAVLAEDAPLERFPERRGRYSASKQEAETYVSQQMASCETRIVILRPGTIYGPGGDLYTPMMGFRAGSTYAVIGSGNFQLPFVHIDNVVSAIGLCLEREQADGEIFNVVDPEPLTKRAYMNEVIRRVDRGARVFYVPYALLYTVTWCQEVAFALMKRRPVLTRYRLTSSQRPIVYNSNKLMTRVDWKPKVALRDALEQLTAAELSPAAATPSVASEIELARSAAR